MLIIEHIHGTYWTGDCWNVNREAAAEYPSPEDLPMWIDDIFLEGSYDLNHEEIDLAYYPHEATNTEALARVRRIR